MSYLRVDYSDVNIRLIPTFNTDNTHKFMDVCSFKLQQWWYNHIMTICDVCASLQKYRQSLAGLLAPPYGAMESGSNNDSE